MSYLGLVPQRDTPAVRRADRARSPRPGSGHARRLLVEAAWHYRKRQPAARRSSAARTASRRNVVAISWQAQQRLHRVWRRLDGERGKRRTIVAVAVARELAGFCWALARAD